jgi:hypothetical protein
MTSLGTPLTAADHRLAEQRQRHGRYRRCIASEPERAGYADNPWDPIRADDERLLLDDTHGDYERHLRDFADALLGENENYARSLIEQYVAYVEADTLGRALSLLDHYRLRSALQEASPRPNLRVKSAATSRLVDAMHAIAYAEMLTRSSDHALIDGAAPPET